MSETVKQLIFALVIIGGLGLLLGVGLAFASKKLYVQEDTRIEDITKMLPGANCGACGNPGCSGFASAIVNGEVVKLSACKPGKPDKNFIPIKEYLEAHPNEDGSIIKVNV